MKAISVFVAAFGVFAMVGCAAGAGEETSEAPSSESDAVAVEVETDKLTPTCNQRGICSGPVYCQSSSSCPVGQTCGNWVPWYGGYYIGTCH